MAKFSKPTTGAIVLNSLMVEKFRENKKNNISSAMARFDKNQKKKSCAVQKTK